jgi:hypothetical protein
MALVEKEELEERAATMVVEEFGAVRFEKRDLPGGPSRTRDFEIVFADGHEEPLEVTTNLDTVVMNALERTDGGNANVKHLWIVSGHGTTSLDLACPVAASAGSSMRCAQCSDGPCRTMSCGADPQLQVRPCYRCSTGLAGTARGRRRRGCRPGDRDVAHGAQTPSRR